MEVVTYLEQIGRFNRLIKNKTIEITQLEQMMYALPSTAMDENKVQTSHDQDRMGSTYCRVEEEVGRLQKEIDELFKKRDKIVKQIDEISEINVDMYDVLTSRFVAELKFVDIEYKLNLSRAQVNRLYNQGLVEFEDRFFHKYSKRA